MHVYMLFMYWWLSTLPWTWVKLMAFVLTCLEKNIGRIGLHKNSNSQTMNKLKPIQKKTKQNPIELQDTSRMYSKNETSNNSRQSAVKQTQTQWNCEKLKSHREKIPNTKQQTDFTSFVLLSMLLLWSLGCLLAQHLCCYLLTWIHVRIGSIVTYAIIRMWSVIAKKYTFLEFVRERYR